MMHYYCIMKHCILMGDITRSRAFRGADLQFALASIVTDANAVFGEIILSPLTITLGDEFQGVVRNFDALCQIVSWFQLERLSRHLPFELHFVLVRGDIETEINPHIAHGMLGVGLSRARSMLTRKDRARPRYQIDADHPLFTTALQNIYTIQEGIEDRWKRRDDAFILSLLQSDNDADIGRKMDKDRSQIYKRRRTLLTDEYSSARTAALTLAQLIDEQKAGADETGCI